MASEINRSGRTRVRPAVHLALLGLLVILLSACQQGGKATPEAAPADAAMHRADPARTGVYRTEGLAEYTNIKWQFAADDWVFGAPAILGGRAYFTSYDGNVYAVDSKTGVEVWRFETGGTIIAAAAVADNIVYVGNMLGTVFALDSATGEERWRVDIGSGFSGSPAVSDGTVYFASENATLVALDAKTGEEKWRFEKPDLAMPFSPAVADGVIYIPVSNGALYAIDAVTGKELWSFIPTTETNIYIPTADAVVKNGLVFFMTNDLNLTGVLYAIDINTHEMRWRIQTTTENYSPPAISDDGIAIWGGLDGALHAASVETGDIIWNFQTDDIIFSATAIAGDTVYFGANDKNLYALDYKTGRQRWQFRAESAVSSPAIQDGVVYVGTEDGTVFALQ